MPRDVVLLALSFFYGLEIFTDCLRSGKAEGCQTRLTKTKRCPLLPYGAGLAHTFTPPPAGCLPCFIIISL